MLDMIFSNMPIIPTSNKALTIMSIVASLVFSLLLYITFNLKGWKKLIGVVIILILGFLFIGSLFYQGIWVV